MPDYIDRVDLIYKLHNLCKSNCAHYPSERDIYCDMCMLNDVLNLIKGCASVDVVPWEWLKRYSAGMFMNYASDWVDYAEKVYKEKMNG